MRPLLPETGGLESRPSRGKCCNPVIGDDIFGFVTVSAGITIHRKDCVNAPRMIERFPYRVVDAYWDSNSAEGAFITKLRIVADDNIGVEYAIRDVLKSISINLRGQNVEYDKSGQIIATITVEVPTNGLINTIIYKLQGIKGVRRVVRV